MTGLPYVKPPQAFPPRRIGNDASGILDVPVLGGLTVQEVDTIADLLADDISPQVAEAEAAVAMAAVEGCTIMEAYQVVRDSIPGEPLDDPRAEEMRLRHAGRIDAVVGAWNVAGRRNAHAAVTAIIRHRLGMPEWTPAETAQLPRLLQEGLRQLIRDEQDAEALPAEPLTEDDLKKPPTAGGDPNKPTGPESSGASATPTPASGADQPSATS